MAIDIPEHEFWCLNPHKIVIRTKGYTEKVKQQLEFSNTVAFIQGQYFLEAMYASVGNMFKGKGTKPFEYPKKPYSLNSNYKDGLSEEEIQAQRDAFVANFMAMKANFELNHPKDESKEKEGQES